MNKYQEALEYMKANAVQEITNSYFRKHKSLDGINFEEFDNNLTTLQELVDKETPKKVKNWLKDKSMACCQICNMPYYAEEKTNYCRFLN